MNILMGAESLTPPRSGIGNYTFHMLRVLSQQAEIGRLYCAAGAQLWDRKASAANQPVSSKRVSGTLRQLKRAISRLPGCYSLRQAMTNRAMRRNLSACEPIGLYHEPNYALRPFEGPIVATIHDLSILRHPEFHPVQRVRHFQRELPRTIQRADRLIADSHFTASEIRQLFPEASEKVSVVHLGVEEGFAPRRREQVHGVLDRHGLGYRRYLLAVGAAEPRKNLDGLLRAYLDLPISIRSRFPLVLTGPAGWRSRRLWREIHRHQAGGMIRHLGFVSEGELACLYSGAAAFAYPSHYEGFGLPVLEAMACGAAVLTSRGTAMEEFVPAGTILVDPRDHESLRAGLERLICDEDYLREFRLSGPARAAEFTWDRCADRTLDIYCNAAGNDRRSPRRDVTHSAEVSLREGPRPIASRSV